MQMSQQEQRMEKWPLMTKGVPGSESQTGGQLVSPAGGCEKKN